MRTHVCAQTPRIGGVLRRFLQGEGGAVTVDWTVLAAAVVGLGVSSVGAVRSGVIDLGGDIETALSGAAVASLGALGGQGGPYRPLSATDEWLFGASGYVGMVAGMDLPAGLLQTMYNSYANAAQQHYSYGDRYHAGMLVDSLYAVHEALRRAGSAPADGAVDFQQLYNQVAAM